MKLRITAKIDTDNMADRELIEGIVSLLQGHDIDIQQEEDE